MMKQDDLADAFNEHVNGKSYLIVLNDLSTFEEWDWIREYFPNNKKGSRIIVSAMQAEVARLCRARMRNVRAQPIICRSEYFYLLDLNS